MIDYLAIASEHVATLYPTIIYAKPQLSDLPPGAIIGTWAYSIPGTARFILSSELELAPGVLPADVSRAWVRDEFELPFKRRKVQLVRSYTVPLHARRGNHGDCCYVDIKGAYLKILSLGYDLEYLPGKYIGADPRPVPPQVASNKFCYSIAVAMSGSVRSNLQVMGKEGLFDHKPINLYSNPCLYNLAQDTLNAVGSEMIAVLKTHCHYANTDGFIIERGYEKYALDIIASWGFKASIKHEGETVIRGVASYKIGDYTTKRFDPSAQDFTSNLMSRDERGWLKARWQKWESHLKD